MPIYKRIFEFTPDAVLVVDPGGRIVDLNARACAMFGYDRDDLLGSPIEALVPKRFGDVHAAHRLDYIAEPRTRPMGSGEELFGCRKDLSEFPVDIMLSTMESDGESLVVCVVRDITRRRWADEKFRSLLEAAPDAMVIVDAKGRIVLVNSQTESVFGYDRRELLGKAVEILIPERYRSQHPGNRDRYFHNTHFRPMGVALELFGLRKDGTEFPVEISLSPLETEEGTFVSSAIRDITARKAADDRIIESLREKEVMLKEIHHRVKNNLAVISSMFYLQSTYTQDDPTLKILRDSQDRVRAMALVHEMLYQSESLASVDFADYAVSLSRQLLQSYSVGTGVLKLATDMKPTRMHVSLAVPCALILNEIITNAIKHAYPNGHGGEIFLSLGRNANGHAVLTVADRGSGLANDVDPSRPASMGMRLIRSLSRQIDGTFELISTQPGTEARLTIPLESERS